MSGKISMEEVDTLDFSTTAVPPNARMPKFGLTMAWWAVCSALFYIVVGAALALGFGSKNAIIGMVLSVIAYSAVNAVLSRYAIRTGLSVALFSRVLFGNVGAGIATLIFCATAIYYAVFEGSVIAVGINTVFPSVAYPVAALIVVLYSVPLIFGSIQSWLDKFNGVLLPFYILGLIVAVALAIGEYGYSDKWLNLGPEGGAPASGWWSCFVAYMGVWVLMMFTFDYARFGRQEDADYHAWFNFGTPFYLMVFVVSGLFGMFMVATVPDVGATEVSVLLALLKLMGIWGLAFVWITQTRINTANYYLAAVNMEALVAAFGKMPFGRIGWAIAVGAIVYVLMLADVFAYLLQALAYQGIFVVAWVAVAMAHILSDRYDRLSGGTVEYRSEQVPALNPLGLTAWFGAAAIGILLHVSGGSYADFSAPATAVVAFAIYAAGLRSARRSWFFAAG
ncbi:purine-cytosine permease family protein [Brucella tritici]|jgi:purine-cytosine permease-like protein|uniref:Allantoin permease n=1 Tax=Brucella tritici TaxID=94626 RepID=A0A6L3Y4N0_9HYPH|nr:allantoin permease [Brucella tritici]KAB2674733.1 allantoin permease [Brucella tritici]